MIRSFLLCLGLALAGGVRAAQVRLPSAPPPAHPDTESVTNAPLARAALDRARLFCADVTLFATPSNNVEIAFGEARRGDGVLLAGDEAFAFGWENGAWFLASSTNRICSATFNEAAERTLSFRLRVRADGSPVSFSMEDAAAGNLFPHMTNAPPSWLFSRDWDAVRLTVRGTDERNERLSVRLETDAAVLILK